MTDIVERLRSTWTIGPLEDAYTHTIQDSPAPICLEAADEIVKLREMIGAAKAILPRRKNPQNDLQRLVNLAAGLLDDD